MSTFARWRRAMASCIEIPTRAHPSDRETPRASEPQPYPATHPPRQPPMTPRALLTFQSRDISSGRGGDAALTNFWGVRAWGGSRYATEGGKDRED